MESWDFKVTYISFINDFEEKNIHVIKVLENLRLRVTTIVKFLSYLILK